VYVDTGAQGGDGPGRMVVDPDKLMQLKKGIEDEADRVRGWLFANGERLFKIDPPGKDPCSQDTMPIMAQNGQSALSKVDTYVDRLMMVSEKLHESAVAYGVTEDHNAATFRQEPR
jgi:hypothetical protein